MGRCATWSLNSYSIIEIWCKISSDRTNWDSIFSRESILFWAASSSSWRARNFVSLSRYLKSVSLAQSSKPFASYSSSNFDAARSVLSLTISSSSSNWFTCCKACPISSTFCVFRYCFKILKSFLSMLTVKPVSCTVAACSSSLCDFRSN